LNAEKSVQQLRAEISKRLRVSSQLRGRADALMVGGDVDKGIEATAAAQASESAVAALRGKLAQLLPALAQERIAVASPDIEAKARKEREALREEQKRGEKARLPPGLIPGRKGSGRLGLTFADHRVKAAAPVTVAEKSFASLLGFCAGRESDLAVKLAIFHRAGFNVIAHIRSCKSKPVAGSEPAKTRGAGQP